MHIMHTFLAPRPCLAMPVSSSKHAVITKDMWKPS